MPKPLVSVHVAAVPQKMQRPAVARLLLLPLVQLATLALVAHAAAATITASLTVSTDAAVARTDAVFACVNLDWWPASKCDYGTCAWPAGVSLLNADLARPLLRAALGAFGGRAHLRLGGSLSDFVTYELCVIAYRNMHMRLYTSLNLSCMNGYK